MQVGKVDLKNAQPQTHLLNLTVFRVVSQKYHVLLSKNHFMAPEKKALLLFFRLFVCFLFFFLSLFLLITARLSQRLKADLSLEHTNLLTDFILQSEHFLLKIVQGLKTPWQSRQLLTKSHWSKCHLATR